MGVSTTAKVVAASAVSALGIVLINPVQAGATEMVSVNKGSVELIPRCVDAASNSAVWEALNKNEVTVNVDWKNLDTNVSGSYAAGAGSTWFVTNYQAGVNNNTKLSYVTTDENGKDEVERNANNGTTCDDETLAKVNITKPVEEPDHEQEQPGHHNPHHPGHGGGHHNPQPNDDCEENEAPVHEQPGKGAEEEYVEVVEVVEAVEVVEVTEVTETVETVEAGKGQAELAETGASTTLPAILASVLAVTAAAVAAPFRLRRQS